MNDTLRQLLEMINVVPAPGRVPNTTAPTQDLGRVGGTTQQAARMPNMPMQDNGLGSMEPMSRMPLQPVTPGSQMAPLAQQPAYNPDEMGMLGSSHNPDAGHRNVIFNDQDTPMQEPDPEFDPEQTMITKAEPARARHLKMSAAEVQPVHLHFDSEMLDKLSKRKMAED